MVEALGELESELEGLKEKAHGVAKRLGVSQELRGMGGMPKMKKRGRRSKT